MAAIGLALLTGAFFGGVLVSVRLAVSRRGADPVIGALVAVAVAAVVAASGALLQGASLSAFSLGDAWPFLVVGAVSPGASHSAFYPAIRLIGSSRAGILTGAAPMLAALLAILFLDEPLRLGVTTGMLLIVGAGTLLVYEPARPAELKAAGIALAFLTALFFGIRDVLARSVATGTRAAMPSVAAATTLLGGTLVLGVVVPTLLARRDLRARLHRTIVPFVPTGVLTGLGWITLFAAIERAEVTVVSPLFSTQTGWTVLLGALLLGRIEAGPRVVVAAPLMMAGSALIGLTR